jgi:D-serine deaminase-like pyridoxal phosphate-dependent protein
MIDGMMSRRLLLAAAPAVLTGAPRSWSEVEKILASGNVKGKLAKDELPTPALIVDLDGLESNINKMAAYLKAQGRGFRPHAKTHKCAEIARRCMAAGAVGACAAKIGEAEVLASKGIKGLLLTTAMVGKYRIERAVRLAGRNPETIFSVDNAQNVTDLNDAAKAAGRKVRVAADLAVSGRTGITPGEPAVALVEHIAKQSHLEFQGIQAYAGHCAHIIGFDKRKKGSEEAMGRAVETRRMLEKKGIQCSWLSGGSTGTYNIDSHIDGITEIQPGSFLFMDIDYNRIGGKDGNAFYGDFQNSLTVIATAYSKPSDDFVVLDAGLKAFSTDKPFTPEARAIAGAKYSWAGDEHGKLDLREAAKKVNLGDRVELVIPHCDPSVNLYDKLIAVRGQQVEAVWPIDARGKIQ